MTQALRMLPKGFAEGNPALPRVEKVLVTDLVRYCWNWRSYNCQLFVGQRKPQPARPTDVRQETDVATLLASTCHGNSRNR